MTVNVVVRQATHHDAAIIVRFNALMGEETEGKKLDERILEQGVRAILSDPSKGVYYVAEIDSRVVGQLMITYEWSDWRNSNFWWIQSVYVEREYRKQGVFASLFEHMRALAKSRHDICGLRLYVEKANVRAQSAYERLGMKRSHYEMFELELKP